MALQLMLLRLPSLVGCSDSLPARPRASSRSTGGGGVMASPPALATPSSYLPGTGHTPNHMQRCQAPFTKSPVSPPGCPRVPGRLGCHSSGLQSLTCW